MTLLVTTYVVANNYLFVTTCSRRNVSFVYIKKVVAINISNDLSLHEYQYLWLHIVANNMVSYILFCTKIRMALTWLAGNSLYIICDHMVIANNSWWQLALRSELFATTLSSQIHVEYSWCWRVKYYYMMYYLRLYVIVNILKF